MSATGAVSDQLAEVPRSLASLAEGFSADFASRSPHPGSSCFPLWRPASPFPTIAVMRVSTRNTKVVFFVTLGACLVAVAVALNVGWIILNWREMAVLVLGIVFFLAIIAGLILNTIFLVREIRRNEQHDSFINAVTHELKTPIASIRLFLETLLSRQVDEAQRHEFYNIMLADTDRLLQTVEQVLR